jgi:hypothetical protein
MSHRAGGVLYRTVRYSAVPYRIRFWFNKGAGAWCIVCKVPVPDLTVQARTAPWTVGRVDVGSIATEICKIKRVGT